MTTALFIGRFQPFHLGHLSAIKEILRENDFIIIGIGSSQESNTAKNPFTSAERREMIKRVLAAEQITNYSIVEIPDAKEDESWAEVVKYSALKSGVFHGHRDAMASIPERLDADVKSRAEFDAVYTSGNHWTRRCLVNAGIIVKFTTFVHGYSSTRIRAKIRSIQPWEDLVPGAVSLYIKEINGVERVRGTTG